MKAYICERCGSNLRKEGNVFRCPHCDAVYSEEHQESLSEALDNVLQSAQIEALAKARMNLYQAVHVKYPSKERVITAAKAVLAIHPQDDLARVYLYSHDTDPYELNDLLVSLNVAHDEALEIVNWLIPSLHERTLGPLKDFIMRHFTNKERTKYLTAIEDEAAKIIEGVYVASFPRDVFLAYSSADMKQVVRMVDLLEENGFLVFASFRNLRHGKGAQENYLDAIKEAMASCKCFVFLSSKHSRSVNCDACKVELPYLIENFPDKPRIEYILEDYGSHMPIVVRKTLKEAFPEQEHCRHEEDLIERLTQFKKKSKTLSSARAKKEEEEARKKEQERKALEEKRKAEEAKKQAELRAIQQQKERELRQKEAEKEKRRQEKIRQKEERRVHRAEAFSNVGHGALFLITLVLCLGSFAALVLGMTYRNNAFVVRAANIIFYVAIGAAIFAFIGCFIHKDRSFKLVVGNVVLTAATIIAVLIYNASGNRGIEGVFVSTEFGFTYHLHDNRTASIIAYDGESEDVVIPEQVSGYTIDWINTGVFANNSQIKSLTLKGPASIGPHAFDGCKNLETITFSDFTYTLFNGAFHHCRNLKAVNIGKAELYYAYEAGKSTECAFLDTNPTFYLDGGVLNESWITGMQDHTASMILGPNSKSVGPVFNTLVIKDGFTFDTGSITSYSSPLFNNYYHPAGKVIYIPTSVTSIPRAFFGDSLPDGSGYTVKVYYAGTQQQWSAIDIDRTNNGLYNDGKIEIHYETPYAE
ncbi:MAG: leucine-rich repeat protein [Bacilli bacterium]|nr:leucine-rich repeat protein [Bacilli bacterium]